MFLNFFWKYYKYRYLGIQYSFDIVLIICNEISSIYLIIYRAKKVFKIKIR